MLFGGRLAGVAVTAWTLACAPEGSQASSEGEPAREREVLAEPERWQQSGEDGPFAGHRPDEVSCPPQGALLEAGAYEVQTDACNYLSATQTTLVEIRAGDTLVVDWAHSDLVSPQPAVAHLGIGIGGEVVWQTEISLQPPPNAIAAAAQRTEVVLEFDAPVGTNMYMHLHNHGANSWRFFTFELIPG